MGERRRVLCGGGLYISQSLYGETSVGKRSSAIGGRGRAGSNDGMSHGEGVTLSRDGLAKSNFDVKEISANRKSPEACVAKPVA